MNYLLFILIQIILVKLQFFQEQENSYLQKNELTSCHFSRNTYYAIKKGNIGPQIQNDHSFFFTKGKTTYIQKGKINEIGVQNLPLSAVEVNNSYNYCSTPVPTGNPHQILCGNSTINDLIATGTNIKWYASATGGIPLENDSALVDGTLYYASQTIGCESVERFPVLVDLINATITSSATTICTGAPVTLMIENVTANDFNILDFSNRYNFNLSTYYWGGTDFLTMPTGIVTHNAIPYSVSSWSNTYNSWNARYETYSVPISLELNFNSQKVSEFNFFANTFWGYGGPYSFITIEFYNNSNLIYSKNLYGNFDIRDYSQGGYTNYINNATTTNFFVNGNRRLDNIKIQLPSAQNINKIIVKDYGNNGFQRIFVVAATISIATPITTYLWSTGETTPSINPSPNATTTYWCDVTVNGITCRKEITITVNNPTTTPILFN